MTEGKLGKRNIISGISAVAAVLGALAAIITAYSKMPIIFQQITVILLVIIAAMSAYMVIGQPLIRFIKKLILARKDNITSIKCWCELDSFVDRLGELFSSSRSDNIPYALQKLRNIDSRFYSTISSSDEFSDLYNVFKNAGSSFVKNKTNLLLRVKWFESILTVYHNQLVCKPVENILTISRNISNPEKLTLYKVLKEDYNKNKTIYIAFLLDYMKFAKAINKNFNQQIARDYFALPNDL